MASNIRMDTHKLIYHVDAVANWLHGGDVWPIEVEISPSGACNHRCVFCAVDYLGYKPNFLDADTILRDIAEMQKHGLKSVICSGEGEPLLNKDLPRIVNGIKAQGVDVAMSTNGVLFTEEKLQECLAAFTWVRYSVASMCGGGALYEKIQGAQHGDLDKVKANLKAAVRVKKEMGLSTTLGVQCLLLPENKGQVVDMARELRGIGVDYLTVKPYSQHKHSENKKNIDYEELLSLEGQLKECEGDGFAVYFRANAMHKMHHGKKYKECLGLPFMTHIDAKGNVWPCVAHIGAEGLCYGNINESTFREIWEGEKRQEVAAKLRSADINTVCREACRLDAINEYLDELRHPGAHVNFI